MLQNQFFFQILGIIRHGDKTYRLVYLVHMSVKMKILIKAVKISQNHQAEFLFRFQATRFTEFLPAAFSSRRGKLDFVYKLYNVYLTLQ